MNSQEQMAYRALSHAAERMGTNNFARLRPADRARMARGPRPGRLVCTVWPNNWPTPAHRDVVQAMDDLGRGTIDAEDAMALLWRSDVWSERFPTVPNRRSNG